MGTWCEFLGAWKHSPSTKTPRQTDGRITNENAVCVFSIPITGIS